jgi:hypothetical protein
MILRTLLLVLISVTSAAAQSKDLTLIRKLPERMAAMNKEGHKKWDTGVTFTMLEGTSEFNEGLIGILKELIRHHAEHSFIQESEVDAYVKTLVSKLEFEAKLGNPSGEDRGTLAGFEVPAGLSVELRNAIVILVRAIVENEESFDFNGWHKEWEKSCKSGD